MNRAAERERLLDDGLGLVQRFCAKNKIKEPGLTIYEGTRTDFGVCAYYRDGCIHIWPQACAAIGRAGRQWSYPGYVVDRTPYGVMAHELAHYVDDAHGPRGGTYGKLWRMGPGITPLTGYCPNSNEWFAEMFRLFVTNPDLLRRVRPYIFDHMITQWKPVERRTWQQVLKRAPRQQRAAINKIRHAAR